MNPSRLFGEFFNSEKSSGIVLIVFTALSLLIANVFATESYFAFWEQKIGFTIGNLDLHLSIEHWINDGLMAFFFLLVGLEIKREIFVGELSDKKNAALPVVAAIGGMAIPALIHFLLNNGTATQSGFGIPMATDIAFALGILSLAGNKVPLALKVFLTALAIIDDLGAILVIALFYTEGLQISWLLGSLGIFLLLLALNRLFQIRHLAWYLIGGIIMWYCMLQSGVHATITGVLLAFAIPFEDGKHSSPSYVLQHALHKPVAFLIVPIFAFANTNILLNVDFRTMLQNRNSLGIIGGLVIGKPIGIFMACWLSVKFGIARIPAAISRLQIWGAGVLAGIGFTMSIFITLLAFDDALQIQYSKIAILLSSLIAAVAGYLVLKKTVGSNRKTQP